jgi:uncharacterized damage-inducible protein DinB
MLPPLRRTGELDMAGFVPSTDAKVGDAVAALNRSFDEARQIAGTLSDEAWGKPARLMAGTKVEWETTLGQMVWGFLLDLIHHRGQLSVYIRPMGGKVPPIYGPSADANG